MTLRDPDQIWGPRIFTPGALKPDEVRTGKATEWCERALILSFFINHDNEPTPWGEIQEWIDGRTPEEIVGALTFAAEVGFP